MNEADDLRELEGELEAFVRKPGEAPEEEPEDPRALATRQRFFYVVASLCALAWLASLSIGWGLRSRAPELAVAVQLSRLGGGNREAVATNVRPRGEDPWGHDYLWRKDPNAVYGAAGARGSGKSPSSRFVLPNWVNELPYSRGPDGVDDEGGGDDLTLDQSFDSAHALGALGPAAGWALLLDLLFWGAAAGLWLLFLLDIKKARASLPRELLRLLWPVSLTTLVWSGLLWGDRVFTGLSLLPALAKLSLAPVKVVVPLTLAGVSALAFLLPRLWFAPEQSS